jgi:hypothetical protein
LVLKATQTMADRTPGMITAIRVSTEYGTSARTLIAGQLIGAATTEAPPIERVWAPPWRERHQLRSRPLKLIVLTRRVPSRSA